MVLDPLHLATGLEAAVNQTEFWDVEAGTTSVRHELCGTEMSDQYANERPPIVLIEVLSETFPFENDDTPIVSDRYQVFQKCLPESLLGIPVDDWCGVHEKNLLVLSCTLLNLS